MSTRGTWKRRVSPGYPSVGSAVSVFFFGHFFLGNENAGGSATCIHKDMLLEEAIVTHLITCQGRDYIVNIQSGRQSPVIVNVHFEPELTSRQLRERMHLIYPHWPSYPNAVGIILCDSQHLRLRRRTIQRVESDIHRRRPEKDRHISILFSTSP